MLEDYVDYAGLGFISLMFTGKESSCSPKPAIHYSSCCQSAGLVTVVHEKQRGRI